MERLTQFKKGGNSCIWNGQITPFKAQDNHGLVPLLHKPGSLFLKKSVNLKEQWWKRIFLPSVKSVSELSAAPLVTLPRPSIKAANPILFFFLCIKL